MNNSRTISGIFRQCADKNEKVLIPYLTAGYPDMDRCFDLIRDIERGGADMIELGIPFSDPVADGATIQYSSQIAIEKGATLIGILDRLENFSTRVPLILMTYVNPLLGVERNSLFRRMNRSRISALVIADLPVEMAGEWSLMARRHEIDLIMLAAPTSPDERLRRIASASRGFVYCVSVTGTTGVRQEIPEPLPAFLIRVRLITDKPIAVGFGISSPDQISGLSAYADGFVVGSRVISAIRQDENVEKLVAELKAATRRKKTC